MRLVGLWTSVMRAASAIAAWAHDDGENTVARIELVIDKRSIDPGQQVTVRLVNRGTVPVLTGLAIREERWNGECWVRVEHDGFRAWPLIGITLRPRQRTKKQTWPFGGSEPQPGCYRLSKSARYGGHPEQDRRDSELVATAIVQVTSD